MVTEPTSGCDPLFFSQNYPTILDANKSVAHEEDEKAKSEEVKGVFGFLFSFLLKVENGDENVFD